MFLTSRHATRRSEVVLTTVCETSEKVLPAITVPCRAASPDAERDERAPLRAQPEDQSPELDVCVLQPLDFDASAGQCLALHQRRRFGRQRGSISLDGNRRSVTRPSHH